MGGRTPFQGTLSSDTMARNARDFSAKTAAIWLGLFFVLALVIRIAFNVGVAHDPTGDRYLYSGNDPYYHDRTVDHIVTTGESLLHDPGINYPNGGMNPNPPLYDWTVAMDAGLMAKAGIGGAVSLALNLAVAFWGALLVIPVFMIASSLWDRKAGIWAAFFAAVSAPLIQRSAFGFADHDATTIFWIVLAFAFMIKALQALDGKLHVKDWTSADRMTGIKNAFSANHVAMLWAALAGTALAATALTWKGYPYALAVMAVGFGLQLLLDHQRHKDSTALAGVYLIPMLLVTLVPLPYYWVTGRLDNTIMAGLYVLLGMLVAAAILIPTREMPSIVVFPSLIGAGLLGLLIMLVVFPDIGRTIFTGLGYFQQSKLYTTIAEAQRTELGFVVANMGFFTFFLALWGWGRSIKRGYKGEPAMLLMASWGAVAIFMALAASRFVANAAPVFAILSAGVMAPIISVLRLEEVSSRFRKLHGQGNAVSNGFRSVTMRSAFGVATVAFLLVLPNFWLGIDAGASAQFERENELNNKRWGAFGLNFDIASNGWLEAMDHLATLDQDLAFEDRPAFIAWWDYGHWATDIGKHPTVADPFQSQFELSGRFLASESEEESTAWLSLLLIRNDLHSNGGQLSGPVRDVLTAHSPELAGLTSSNYDTQYELWAQHVEGDAVFDLYEGIQDATGHAVGYMGVDVRMFPINLQNSGIFYAPAFLANKNPDDFISYTYSGAGLSLTMRQYDVDEAGNSYRLAQPTFTAATGEEYDVYGGQAYPKGSGALLGLAGPNEGVSVQPALDTKPAFQQTMYARAFGHYAAQVPAGDGLRHWRVIHQSVDGDTRLVALLQYFQGTEVTGTVRDDQGRAMAGVDVTFIDGFGASHDAGTTDESGAFTALAPPGDDIMLAVRQGGSVVHEQSFPVATDGDRIDGVSVTVPTADLSGVAFRDLDGDGQYNASNDDALSGVTVSLGGSNTTTGINGRYSFANQQAGSYNIRTVAHGYAASNTPVTLPAGANINQNLALSPLESSATLRFEDAFGQDLAAVPMELTGPTTTTVTTNATGYASVSLAPGAYTLTIDHAFTDSEGVEVSYDEERSFTVPFGGADFTYTVTQG